MAVITPRNGDTLARVVQTALNIAGRGAVSIETGGTGNGVRVPDDQVAAIEAELGWTAAEALDAPAPTQEPTPPPTPATTQEAGEQESGSDSSDPDGNTSDPEEEAAAAPAAAPAKKTTAKKTTQSSTRRARRGKEG